MVIFTVNIFIFCILDCLRLEGTVTVVEHEFGDKGDL